MKISQQIYKTLLVLILVLQIWIPSVEFLVVFSGVCVFFLVSETKVKLSENVFNILSYLAIILVIGLVVSFFHSYSWFDKIRDFVHFIKPILVLLLGYLLCRKIKDHQFIIKTIIYVGVAFSIYHLGKLGFADLKKGTIEEIRAKGGIGNFIELLALVFLIAKKRFSNFDVIPSKIKRNVILIILFTSFCLYFSRTMLLGAGIFLFSFYGYTKMTRKAIKYIAIASVLFGVFYAYLFTLNLDADKPGIQQFFFKIRNAPAEVFSPPSNYNPSNQKEIFKYWRAYEASKAVTQMQENPINYVVGRGFGSLVDLGFKAPIGGEDGLRYVPHIHNGYVYVFFKTGIIGLFFYLVMLFNLYKQTYLNTKTKKEKLLRRIISGFGSYYFFTSLIITGIYNFGEISFFCLGLFLYLVHAEKRNNENEVND